MDVFYKIKREEDINLMQEDCVKSSRSMKSGSGPERRLKRQIANSNERKRMQTINAGFQSLRLLLPITDERLSKAAILQQAVDYITHLLVERQQLLKRVTISPEGRQTSPITATVYPQVAKHPKSEPLTLKNVAVTSLSNFKQKDINQYRRKEKILREEGSQKGSDGENKMIELTPLIVEDGFENAVFNSKSNYSKEQRVPHPESDIFLATSLNSNAEFLLNADTRTLLSNAQNLLFNNLQNSPLNSIVYAQPRFSNEQLEVTYSQSKTYTQPDDILSHSNVYTLAQLNVQVPSTLQTQTSLLTQPNEYSLTEPSVYAQSEPGLYTGAQPVFLAPSSGCSLSRRNLETIFEAIQHLEGGGSYDGGFGRVYAGHSEESGHESCASDDDLGAPKKKKVPTATLR